MASTILSNDFSHLEDVLGSLPMLRRYTVLCLCFHRNNSKPIFEIEQALQSVLEKLTKGFPFLAGQVVYEGRDEHHSGNAKILPYKARIELEVNDLTNAKGFPTMAEMSTANFPFSMLDSTILLPPIAVSWSTDRYDSIAPVLLLQANFIRGGLLLSFSINHATTDMTGLGIIISLFSKACRNEPFTKEELESGNRSRRDVVPLLADDYEPGAELDNAFTQPPGALQISFTSPPKWKYFDFAVANLSRLKEAASQQALVPYISTDDAVAALCWQSIAKARDAHSGRHIKSQFARPISVRKYLGLEGYLGYMVDVVYESEVDVWRQPLGDIAGRLRRILQANAEIKHHIQALATVLNRLNDKSKLVHGAHLHPERDIVFSSYANIKCCELSFGPLLGMPEAARRPDMPAWPSLLYMMPKSRQGNIAVAFCLVEEDFVRLRQDEVFTSYATYIG